ncbi:GNAT family N-acetyltransferase [Shewanella sp. MMG014]|uniref:GNAT family N-acetyltransferase n=1 Tax=Shewanella sp. MMG014 TaxID=2822691 RepID=UPI001B37D8FA|nr:GNAT family N-acetyltransferase [Shewanella sp. MMG014]MBQ4891471.1 GNAT family N-acetyltransferase [Shewanella sp. MMG014]
MQINKIEPSMWQAIFELQCQVYTEIEPESLQVLRGKWLHSPHCCFVLQDKADNILAYLLAHEWHDEMPPKLYQPLLNENKGDRLFLHDLAVSKALKGKGAGKKMVTELIDIAKAGHYQHIQLVAIQHSVPFWQKMGFSIDVNNVASETYGDNAQVMGLTL